MARTTNKLTDKGVKALKDPGTYSDGAGLYLIITRTRTKHWAFWYKRGGRRREMGLGSFSEVSLAKARDLARAATAVLQDGKDPIEERDAAPVEAAPEMPTFGAFALHVIDSKKPGWRGRDTEARWTRAFKLYAAEKYDTPVDEICTDDIVEVLKPIWMTKAESAGKARECYEAVLDAAIVKGHHKGPNPARWKGHLSHLLPKRPRLQRGHHPAVPVGEIPTFYVALTAKRGMAARALEWTLLTAARESMTLGARWKEIDEVARVWNVPGARMKEERDFRIPISDAAWAVLERVRPPVADPEAFIFPSPMKPGPMSDAAMDNVMKEIAPGYVPHGLRSTFRDWVGEGEEFSERLAEIALDHVQGDETERAYRRGDALERRRPMMQGWAQFCVQGIPQAHAA